jgi:hypothetical protein
MPTMIPLLQYFLSRDSVLRISFFLCKDPLRGIILLNTPKTNDAEKKLMVLSFSLMRYGNPQHQTEKRACGSLQFTAHRLLNRSKRVHVEVTQYRRPFFSQVRAQVLCFQVEFISLPPLLYRRVCDGIEAVLPVSTQTKDKKILRTTIQQRNNAELGSQHCFLKYAEHIFLSRLSKTVGEGLPRLL